MDILLGMLAICATVELFIVINIKDNTYKKAHEEGWNDCYRAYKQFEMSEDDILVLEAMKKALKEYIRRKKYVKEEDRKALDAIEDFEQFKHFVFLTCVYRKEMNIRTKDN